MLSFRVFVVAHSRRTVSLSSRDLCGRRLLRPCRRVGVYPEPSRRALDCSSFAFSARLDLSHLECAVTDKHRVLPVFSRNRQQSSPLEATLTSILVGVDSKRFTIKPKSFRCNIYKKTRGEGPPSNQEFFPSVHHAPPVSPLQGTTFGATIPKGTRFLYDPGKQLRSPRCLRVRERTSGTARSWSPLQVVPGSSVLRRVSGFVLANPEQAGFRVCTYKP